MAKLMRVNSRDIDWQAAEWAGKARGEKLAPAEQAALDAWLAANDRHLGAYLKARAVIFHAERYLAAGAWPGSLDVHANSAYSRRRLILVGSVAASLAAFAVIGLLNWQTPKVTTLSSEFGEMRVFPLTDGSSITLNTSSRVVVHVDRRIRAAKLERGEALFDVAHDKSRPFVVEVQKMVVRAVGTSFVVRSVPGEPVKNKVREGIVLLSRPGAAAISLVANTSATVERTSDVVVATLSPAEVEQQLAWRDGHIYFRNETLLSAAKEFKRYSRTAIVIDDPLVGNLTVTGLYVSNDPVGFAKAVAFLLDLKADTNRDGEHLTHKTI